MANKQIGGLIVFVIMFFFGVAPVSATSYYVSPSGNDSQSGSLSQPWLTVAKGMVTARSGDTLYLRAGQYNAPATGWQFAQGGVTLTNFPGERVTLYSYSPNSGNYIIKCLLVSPAVNGNKIIGTDVGGQKGLS